VELETEYEDGEMLIGVCNKAGQTSKTIVFNSNNCHPHMANDGFAGTAVLIRLFQWLATQDTYYSYRLVIAPEHLGSVFYLNGGVGRYEHFPAAILVGNAAAAAAANIFHFFELSYPYAKQACLTAGIPMRPIGLGSQFLRREPEYDRSYEDARIAKRLYQAETGEYAAARPKSEVFAKIRWCTACVYPSISAAPMEFDGQGVCTGCQMARVKAQIPAEEWARRKGLLRDLLEQHRCRDGTRHDVVVAVSGGKDSYFQVHVLKDEFGVIPLLVTYG